MGFRDRFYTPATAKAILSWRIPIGIGVAVSMAVAGVGVIASAAVGAGVYVGLVATAMPRAPKRPRIDPFAVGEPWRQYVQGAQRAASRLHRTIADTADGPLRERMEEIAAKLDHGLDETWRIARRGDEIDDAVKRLDPVALRSKRDTLTQQAETSPSDEVTKALESVESQLATTDRLKQRSEKTANTLRLTQTRLDELVARASEVAIGAGDTEQYDHDVEDLVVELESLRLAVEETGRA